MAQSFQKVVVSRKGNRWEQEKIFFCFKKKPKIGRLEERDFILAKFFSVIFQGYLIERLALMLILKDICFPT